MIEPKTRALMERMLKMGEYVFEKSEGNVQLTTAWRIEDASGQTVLIPTPWGDINEKDAYIAAIRELMSAFDAVRYGLLMEVWGLPDDVPPEEAKALYESGGGCADHPRRIESIMVQAEDHSGNARVIRRINRTPKPTLGEPQWFFDNFEEGRLSNLLPRPKQKVN